MLRIKTNNIFKLFIKSTLFITIFVVPVRSKYDLVVLFGTVRHKRINELTDFNAKTLLLPNISLRAEDKKTKLECHQINLLSIT